MCYIGLVAVHDYIDELKAETSAQETFSCPHAARHHLVSSEPAHRALQACIASLPGLLGQTRSCDIVSRLRENIQEPCPESLLRIVRRWKGRQHKEGQSSPMLASELVRTVIVESLVNSTVLACIF